MILHSCYKASLLQSSSLKFKGWSGWHSPHISEAATASWGSSKEVDHETLFSSRSWTIMRACLWLYGHLFWRLAASPWVGVKNPQGPSESFLLVLVIVPSHHWLFNLKASLLRHTGSPRDLSHLKRDTTRALSSSHSCAMPIAEKNQVPCLSQRLLAFILDCWNSSVTV